MTSIREPIQLIGALSSLTLILLLVWGLTQRVPPGVTASLGFFWAITDNPTPVLPASGPRSKPVWTPLGNLDGSGRADHFRDWRSIGGDKRIPKQISVSGPGIKLCDFTVKLTIALAQINTRLGNMQTNLEKHLTVVQEASASGVDLIVFPELSLTGYVLQDLATTVTQQANPDNLFFQPLLEASEGIDLVVGFVDEDWRQRFFIASAYLSRGEIVHVHRKVYLPTYGLFDEGRFFAWGDSVQAFDTRFGWVGLLICEDFWQASPPYLLWLDGADLFLFSSASPGRGFIAEPQLESAHWVEHINRAYASLFTSFVVHANRVGFEDGLNFWGGSTVFDPNGDLIAQGPYHEEALTLAEIDLSQMHRTRTRLPLLRDEQTQLTLRELRRIVGENNKMNG